jgi:hypothetical protein
MLSVGGKRDRFDSIDISDDMKLIFSSDKVMVDTKVFMMNGLAFIYVHYTVHLSIFVKLPRVFTYRDMYTWAYRTSALVQELTLRYLYS